MHAILPSGDSHGQALELAVCTWLNECSVNDYYSKFISHWGVGKRYLFSFNTGTEEGSDANQHRRGGLIDPPPLDVFKGCRDLLYSQVFLERAIILKVYLGNQGQISAVLGAYWSMLGFYGIMQRFTMTYYKREENVS